MAGVDKDAISQFSGPNPKYKVSIDPTSNNTWVVGAGKGSDALPIYLYVSPDGVNYTVFGTKQEAIDAYIAACQAVKTKYPKPE